MIVKLHYKDDTFKEIDNYSIDGFDSSEPVENQSVRVSYNSTVFTEIKVTINSIEHVHTSETSGTITKTATTTSVGVITYKCSGCNEEIKKELYCGPFGEDGKTATSSSKNIYFGVFPKTIKSSSVKIDVKDKVKMGPNTYYKGDDGEWYAKVTANPYDTFYSYSDSTSITQGNTDYFKVEPIKWRVLTTDYNGTKKALLLADECLTSNVPYYVSISDRTINGKTIYANNYMYSTIRAYLNGKYESDDTQTATYNNAGFLQIAFTASAQALIADTTVVNDGASTSDATGTVEKADGSDCIRPDFTCADTKDKIFLLSEQEVTTTAYGFFYYNGEGGSGNERIRYPTDYAKANYCFRYSNYYAPKYNNRCSWILRSPTTNCSYTEAGVVYEGTAYASFITHDKKYGVVPALSIAF